MVVEQRKLNGSGLFVRYSPGNSFRWLVGVADATLEILLYSKILQEMHILIILNRGVGGYCLKNPSSLPNISSISVPKN